MSMEDFGIEEYREEWWSVVFLGLCCFVILPGAIAYSLKRKSIEEIVSKKH